MLNTRPLDTATRGPSRRRRAVLVATACVVALLVVVGFLAVREFGRPLPAFPSLAQTPDASLHGTVAYFAEGSRCVRIVAAAGQPAKDLLCVPEPDMARAVELGTKEDGPQLVWRADGRLEVTMFRADPKDGDLQPRLAEGRRRCHGPG